MSPLKWGFSVKILQSRELCSSCEPAAGTTSTCISSYFTEFPVGTNPAASSSRKSSVFTHWPFAGPADCKASLLDQLRHYSTTKGRVVCPVPLEQCLQCSTTAGCYTRGTQVSLNHVHTSQNAGADCPSRPDWCGARRGWSKVQELSGPLDPLAFVLWGPPIWAWREGELLRMLFQLPPCLVFLPRLPSSCF